MRKIVITLIVFLPVLFIGCSGTAPTKEDIVGTWVSTEGSVLEFKIDGSFIGTQLPSLIIKSPDMKEGTFDGTGKWSIGQNKKDWDQLPWDISLSFDNAPTEYVAAVSLLISGNNFMENSPPWNYIFFWQEEEGGERYKFEKKHTNQL